MADLATELDIATIPKFELHVHLTHRDRLPHRSRLTKSLISQH
jgi:hypothetical protein